MIWSAAAKASLRIAGHAVERLAQLHRAIAGTLPLTDAPPLPESPREHGTILAKTAIS
jgi:hypothetical protein